MPARNMNEITTEDIQIHSSSCGLECITLAERAMENHQGGLHSSKNKAAAAMSEMLGNPHCPVLAVKTYLLKRNKQCKALWQKPKNHKAMKFNPADDVWYCNAPPGKHRLQNLFSQMSKKEGLATSHWLLPIVCKPPLWWSWRHLGLEMPEWSRWPAIRVTQPLKATTNVLPSSSTFNCQRLQATLFLAPLSIRLGKKELWWKSSKTNLWRNPDFKCRLLWIFHRLPAHHTSTKWSILLSPVGNHFRPVNFTIIVFSRYSTASIEHNMKGIEP